MNASRGWVVGNPNDNIVATTNGGATWTKQDSGPAKNGPLFGLAFSDASHAWAVGSQGMIIATANGGTTWTQQTLGSTADLYGVAVADASHAWAVGLYGTILATTDGGATWRKQYTGIRANLNGVSFPDALRGWATGYDWDTKVSPATPQTVSSGSMPTFTFAPDPGYQVMIMTVDGDTKALTGPNQYTFPPVTADHALSVTFGYAPPKITVTAPIGSSTLAPDSSLTVSWATDYAVSEGEFSVWASRASGWYVGKLVPRNGTASYSTDITLSVPLGGPYHVQVGYRQTVGSGGFLDIAESAGQFTVGVVPAITSFLPTSGAVGASLTLTGTDFTGATAVTFNGTAATSFSVVSGTQITATVPAAATSGPIAVTTPGGTGTSTTSFTVTAPLTPVLTITAPTGTGSHVAGSALTVNWTSSPALAYGEFAAWARSAAGAWYIGDLVAAGASTSYSRAITLSVPPGSGYQAIVSWRPAAGSGAWLAFGTQTGSFTVTPWYDYARWSTLPALCTRRSVFDAICLRRDIAGIWGGGRFTGIVVPNRVGEEKPC